MDILIIVAGIILILLGIAGCFLPVLPGPHLAWLALVVLQFSKSVAPDWDMVWITFAVATAVQVLDYIIPALGTKKFGGSKYGVWGAMIGLIVGLITPLPFGVILGPFLGALIGELIKQQKSDVAIRAAMGSLVGFLFSVGLKLAVTLYFAWIFVKQIPTMWS